MAGFWAGFGDSFQTSYLEAKNRRFRSEEAEKDREWRAEERRNAAAEKRKEALLSLAIERDAKRRTAQESVAKYAGDVTWVASKLDGAEGAEDYILTLQNNPELANRIRKRVEEEAEWAARNVSKEASNRILNMDGNELMRVFQVAGTNPEELEDGDITSIIPEIESSDGSMEDYYELGTRIYEATPQAGVPTSTLIQTEPLAADTEYSDFEAQKKVLMDKIGLTLDAELARLRDSNASQKEIEEVLTMKNTLGKDEGAGLQNEIMQRFMPEILANAMEAGNMPGLEQNPYFQEYIPITVESQDHYEELVNTLPYGEHILYVPGKGPVRLNISPPSNRDQ